jgi:UDP-N-acetylglucosamine/UDP-N-acetylgalactosamine diphosphorylase
MPSLTERLSAAGQDHLLDALDRLDADGRARLAAQIEAIDLARIGRLFRDLTHGGSRDFANLEPPDVIPLPSDEAGLAREREARDAGEELLRANRVAAVLVAGGQGTRLGFDGPKGAFPFAPITGRILFAHHAAKIAAARRRYGCDLPWYVMTSPQNDAETRDLFARNAQFGLPEDSIRIFVQGTMPAVDRTSGRILLEAPDRVATSPDGHGGLFPALARHGLLAAMRERGIETFFTFQVDNPLTRVARPEFLGAHVLAAAEMSNVVVRKLSAEERMGVVARQDGRTTLVEYSDLPDDLARACDPHGELVFWAGSIAVHAVDVALAERITAGGGGLPFHAAIKPVAHVDPTGTLVSPDAPNAVKFESFIFDALPLATRVCSLEAAREDEFSPIKNADGADSPATARRDLNRAYARWLEAAGVDVPRDETGEPAVDIEIDPRYATNARELKRRITSGFRVTGPTVLEPPAGG